MRRNLMTLAVVLVIGLLAVGPAMAEKQPVGTVDIESTSVALGVGVQWGGGTLVYQGKEYKFKINGLSVVDLGVSSISATGKVYDMKSLKDFEGTYSAAKAGIALAAGAEGLTMSNQHGVLINLTAKQSGIKFSLALEGVTLTLK